MGGGKEQQVQKSACGVKARMLHIKCRGKVRDTNMNGYGMI